MAQRFDWRKYKLFCIALVVFAAYLLLENSVVTILQQVWPTGGKWLNDNPVQVLLACLMLLAIVYLAERARNLKFDLADVKRHFEKTHISEVMELQIQLSIVQKEIDELVNANMPDMLLGDAIEYIKTINQGLSARSKNDIVTDIKELAHYEKIKVWGMVLREEFPMLPTEFTIPTEIPSEFFYDCHVFPDKVRGARLELLSALPNWAEWRYHERYCNGMVNKAQIHHAFSLLVLKDRSVD